MDTAVDSGKSLSRFLKPRFLVPAAIVAVVGLAIVLFWFQPQALFLDKRVDESAPGAMEKEDSMMKEDSMKKDEGAMAKDDAMMEKEGAMMMSGSFRGLKYETTGKATLDKASDGHYYVRFENFETQNGPDLFAYLSTAPASAEGEEFTNDFVNLGELKGNKGNQNYQVPDGTDLSKYKSVVIWCERFSVGFGAAPLEREG